MDLKTIFKPNKHWFYEHGKVNFLLALNGNRLVGRLVALNNDDLLPHHKQDTANFFLFESIEDKAVADGLFEKAISWAKQHGASRIYGPKGMTPMDGLGLLIRGFDRRPAFGMPYNPDYYAKFIEEIGFNLVREIESGYINAKTFHIPEKILKAADIV